MSLSSNSLNLPVNTEISIPSSISHIPDKSDNSSNKKMVRKHLENLVETISRWGITATGFLPFSSRAINFKSTDPFGLMIPLRFIQNNSTGSIKNIIKQIVSDQKINQGSGDGISDISIDLESSQHEKLRRELITENFRYAAYMYASFGKIEGGENGMLLFSPDFNRAEVADQQALALGYIMDRFTNEMGFKVDSFGNFYNTKTGSLFNLVYDKERKEVVVCFMGLFSEQYINITPEERKKVNFESLKAAVADWGGGIPPSARQAIRMGEILKDVAQKFDMTPVMIGHSHGGGLAQTAAVANNIKGIVFNSRPMGAGTRRYTIYEK